MTPPPDDRTVEERLTSLEHPPTDNVLKEAVKEALVEWLDEKFAQFGKWTVSGVLAAGLAALVYFILVHNGWKPSP